MLANKKQHGGAGLLLPGKFFAEMQTKKKYIAIKGSKSVWKAMKELE